MPCVRFTSHLKRFFPTLENGVTIAGSTAAEIVAALEARHPGFASYVIDEHGCLRKHVNIFINDDLIHDRDRLSDRVSETDQVFIMQALSGG